MFSFKELRFKNFFSLKFEPVCERNDLKTCVFALCTKNTVKSAGKLTIFIIFLNKFGIFFGFVFMFHIVNILTKRLLDD
jgi:hypothetical protein